MGRQGEGAETGCLSKSDSLALSIPMPPRKRTLDDSQAGDGQGDSAAPARRGGGGGGNASAAAAAPAASPAPPAAAAAAPLDEPLKLKTVQVETPSGDVRTEWNAAFASFAAGLRGSAEMSDVTVVSKCGEKTLAHRWVLASRSDVLRVKLGSTWSTAASVPMDENNAVVQCLLDYMYSGEVSMSVDLALDVLKAATTYQVSA